MDDFTAAFSIARLPRIEFGNGSIRRLPDLAARFGRRVLLVTGGRSYQRLAAFDALLDGLRRRGIGTEHVSVPGEPSPALVDEAAQLYRDAAIDAVIGIGGGSALDAAKAIAGLLRVSQPVMDYLEGVGPELPYHGPAVPFIAVPTTAGTGSEATKNAVLSVHGKHGYKKSFRDEQLVAQYAVVDPELLASCPKDVIAANGMDALTQLIESYVSLRANPFTDALAESGLRAVRRGLLDWYAGGDNVAAARAAMAYAALLSGVTLAQTGLGSVHGLASPLGAFFPIPHGVVCGTLVAAATDANIAALRARDPDGTALRKYARVAEWLTGETFGDDARAHRRLIDLLGDWTVRLALPRLSRYGVGAADIGQIVANARGSSMKTNPIVLDDAEVGEIIVRRL